MRISNSQEQKQPPGQDRRRGSRDAIGRMVKERTEVLALYSRLAGLDPFAGNRQRASAQKLVTRFCELLVDYVAAGHFSLYERIVNGTERRRGLAELAQELYPRIADTTSVVLDFNDKYEGDPCEIGPSFKSDLSRLGEELALRIELEDKLIARLAG